MPELGTLRQVQQGTIHILGVTSGVIRPISIETAVIHWDGEPYEGPYEFTPTQETQTVAINGKTAHQDITINPIPSNYGLITWDGSALTVS